MHTRAILKVHVRDLRLVQGQTDSTFLWQSTRSSIVLALHYQIAVSGQSLSRHSEKAVLRLRFDEQITVDLSDTLSRSELSPKLYRMCSLNKN